MSMQSQLMDLTSKVTNLPAQKSGGDEDLSEVFGNIGQLQTNLNEVKANLISLDGSTDQRFDQIQALVAKSASPGEIDEFKRQLDELTQNIAAIDEATEQDLKDIQGAATKVNKENEARFKAIEASVSAVNDSTDKLSSQIEAQKKSQSQAQSVSKGASDEDLNDILADLDTHKKLIDASEKKVKDLETSSGQRMDKIESTMTTSISATDEDISKMKERINTNLKKVVDDITVLQTKIDQPASQGPDVDEFTTLSKKIDTLQDSKVGKSEFQNKIGSLEDNVNSQIGQLKTEVTNTQTSVEYITPQVEQIKEVSQKYSTLESQVKNINSRFEKLSVASTAKVTDEYPDSPKMAEPADSPKSDLLDMDMPNQDEEEGADNSIDKPIKKADVMRQGIGSGLMKQFMDIHKKEDQNKQQQDELEDLLDTNMQPKEEESKSLLPEGGIFGSQSKFYQL